MVGDTFQVEKTCEQQILEKKKKNKPTPNPYNWKLQVFSEKEKNFSTYFC